MKTLSNAFKKSLFGPIDLFDCGTRMVNTIGPRIANDEKGSRMTDYLKGELVNLNAATERDRARPQTALIMATRGDAQRGCLNKFTSDVVKGPEQAGNGLFRSFFIMRVLSHPRPTTM
jgi:hypothetical protein